MVLSANVLETQALALKRLGDSTTTAVCYGGGAGGGKSFLGCLWLTDMCMMFGGIKAFIGREELKRIKQSTLKTLFNVFGMRNLKNKRHYVYNEVNSTITFWNGSVIDLLDLKRLPSDPLFERFGSTEYTIGFIEEGGEVEYDAYEVLKTRVGRWRNKEFGLLGKVLITCNPKRNWLYDMFYKPHKTGKLSKQLAFIQALAADNDFLDKEYLRSLDEMRNVVQRQRLRDGIWEYDDSELSLFKRDWIESLFTNTYVPNGQKIITSDIARFGKDKTVVMLWNGLRIEKVYTLEKKSIPQVAEFIRSVCASERIPKHYCLVDEDGIGGGVKDLLQCQGFQANSTPARKGNFSNMKSQCYFYLSEYVRDGKLYAHCDENKKTALSEELAAIKWDVADSDNKLRVEKTEMVKRAIGRSPDYASSMMMRMYYEVKSVKPIKV
jgi:hypothetical protein